MSHAMGLYDLFLRIFFTLFFGPTKGTCNPVALLEVFVG